jgi:PAS domain S-box-containing protein
MNGRPITHAEIIAEAAMLFRVTRDWRSHLPSIFQDIGTSLGVSRVFLFQVHELPEGGLGQTCLIDWASPGLKPLSTDPRNIGERISDSDETVMLWAEKRHRGEMIEGHTRDLTGYLRADFEYQEIKSFISFPIWVNGQWWGHMGFDDCIAEREWTASERALLRSVCYMLGDAVELSTSSLIMSEATRVAMLQTAPDGIVVVDESGAILEFNPAAELIFGKRRTQVLGRPVATALVPPASRRAFGHIARRLMRGRSKRLLGRRTEASGLHESGAIIPLEVAVTEIHRADRRLFVAYVRDLTERKRQEIESAKQREALHQSEKMTALGSLLAGVAHELNNPLSVVIGRAIMLEEDAADPAQKERLTKLREAAERCAKVAKTFLAMARQSPAVRAPMSLEKAIDTALDLVAYPLRSAGITVKREYEDNLPENVADFDQMVQVFVNLIVNAEHAMREIEGPRILVVRTGAAAGGKATFAEVRDTGPGIKPDILPRVFEPFFTTKQVGVGTGMGLAVSFGMVAAHGGHLEALPRPVGQGAAFRLTLPVTAKAGVELPRITETAKLSGPAKQRILVVDDEPEVVSLIRDILERAGHGVDHAEDGFRALELAAKKPYDAIFCDLRMPGMDGLTLSRKLGSLDSRYLKRMAFITGDLLGTVKQGESLEGCPLIEKPFHARTITETLGKLTA